MNPVKIGNDVTLSAGCSIISASLDIDSFLKGNHQHVKMKVLLLVIMCG